MGAYDSIDELVSDYMSVDIPDEEEGRKEEPQKKLNRKILSIVDSHRSEMSDETENLISKSLEGVFSEGVDVSTDIANRKRAEAMLNLLSFTVHPYTRADLDRAKRAMDRSHEGLDEIKNYFLDEIASSVMTGATPHPVLLVGAPGCGKTSLASSLASALKAQGSALIPLSGKSATFELAGNDKGWRSADFGLILMAFLQAGSLNPIIIFDELDKIGDNHSYSRADSAFLDLLQPERARFFTDAFMSLPVDVSKAWFIFTANTLEGIPEPILDRLRILEVHPYGFSQLVKIAKRLVDQRNSNGNLTLNFTKKAIQELVWYRYMGAWSVRPIAEAVERIYAFSSRKAMESGEREMNITVDEVRTVVKSPSSLPDLVSSFSYTSGVVSAIGLAGDQGFLTPVEAKITGGSVHEIIVTGLVEQMMGEGASVAYEVVDSWQRKRSGQGLGLVTVNYCYSFRKRGDSASLATALALVSDLTGKPVRKGLAITGALSLKGNVLPVGGVIPKIVGAARQGADEVLVPEANRKDFEDVPSSLLPSIRITWVSSFEEAVEKVFSRERKQAERSA